MTIFIVKNKNDITQHKFELNKNTKFNNIINNLNLSNFNISIIGKNTTVKKDIFCVRNYDDLIDENYDTYVINIINENTEINFLPLNITFANNTTFNDVIKNIFGNIDYSDKLTIVSSTGLRIRNYDDKIETYSNQYYISTPIR
jgi:hypothetical protein